MKRKHSVFCHLPATASFCQQFQFCQAGGKLRSLDKIKLKRPFCLSHFVALICSHYIDAFHLLTSVFADISLSKYVQLFL